MPGYEGRDGFAVRSERAGGTYFISRTAFISLPNLNNSSKVKLTHEIVSHVIAGSTIEISTSTIDGLRGTSEGSVIERAQRLLRYLILSSDRIGKWLEFPADTKHSDDPLVFAIWKVPNFNSAPLLAWSDSLEWDEVGFLIQMLEADGLVQTNGEDIQPSIRVTPKGFIQAEETASKVQSAQAFVAMWFDASMAKAYSDGIEPAVRNAGYRPLRIDNKEHVNKIDDEIVAEIRRSRFIVADFTSAPNQPRGGVYFEAGYAMGRGIPVIWTCHADMINFVHFDTRQFNHIVWDSPADLSDKLEKRILAVLGPGPDNL